MTKRPTARGQLTGPGKFTEGWPSPRKGGRYPSPQSTDVPIPGRCPERSHQTCDLQHRRLLPQLVFMAHPCGPGRQDSPSFLRPATLPCTWRRISFGVIPTPGHLPVRAAVSPALTACLPLSPRLGRQAHTLGGLSARGGGEDCMCVLEPEREGRKTHTGQEHPGSRQRPPRAWRKSWGQRPSRLAASRHWADGLGSPHSSEPRSATALGGLASQSS